MTDFTITTTVHRPYDETVETTRAALADEGFGVLTEIDVRATLKNKLDVDVPAQVILGACRPELAHRALAIEPAIAAVLPCNVVVRSLDEATTVVEAFDPEAMMSLADAGTDETSGRELRAVAADARQRLTAALAAMADH
jgi:uncharacterized protein (DUF302 family)